MNEQALKDAFELFKSGGYNGSQEGFLNLISTNKDAYNDAFNLFASAGYDGGKDGFSDLLGIGKKKEDSDSLSGEESSLSDIPGVGEVSLSGFTRGSRYDEAPVGATQEEQEATQVQREEQTAPVVGQEMIDQYTPEDFDPIEERKYERRVEDEEYAIEQDKKEIEDLNKDKYSLYQQKYYLDKEKEERGEEAVRNDPAYLEREKALLNDYNLLREKSKKIQREQVKVKLQRALQGSDIGAIYNQLLEGISDAREGGVNALTGLTVEAFIGPEDLAKAEGYKQTVIDRAKEKGYYDRIKLLLDRGSDLSPENIKDVIGENRYDDLFAYLKDRIKKTKKAANKEVFNQIRNEMRDLFGSGTTKEYEDAFAKTLIGRSLQGAARTIPNLITPGGPLSSAFRVSQMYLSGTNAIDDIMNNLEAFDDISENERLLVKAPLGIIVAVLEEYGFRNLIKNSGVMNRLVMNVLGKTTKSATPKTLGALVRNEVDSMVARGLITATGGALAEFETGVLQGIADLGVKNLYNYIKDEELFTTTDEKGNKKSLPWITDGSFYEEVLMSGVEEAIGGFALGAPNSIAAAFRKKGFEGFSDTEFTLFSLMSQDNNLESAYVASLKSKVSNGEMTMDAAKERLNEYRNARGLFSKIPQDLSTKGQKKAMNLLIERQQIQKEIEGKDQSLTKKQRDRIQEINQNLENLSEDAVQEQSADEVPVQPDAAVGEEVEGRVPETKPKVATEETEEEIIEEEDKETIGDALKSIANVYMYDGERGILTTDGKTVVLETPTKIIEIGNVDQISQSAIDDFNLVKEGRMDISVGSDNSVTVNGKTYQNTDSDPIDAISQDKNGNYSVTLYTENGQKRTFRGQRAQEIVYQYKLKEFEQNATEEEIESANQRAEEAIRVEEETRKNAPKRKTKAVRKRKKQPKVVEEKSKKQPVKGFQEATEDDLVSDEVIDLKGDTVGDVISVERDDSGKVTAVQIENDKTGEITVNRIDEQATEQGTQAPIEGTKLRDNIKKAVAKVFTKTDSRSFKNGKEMAAYAKEKYGQDIGQDEGARVFINKDGSVEILVNEELADDTSFGHEVWHPLIIKAFGDNQKKFKKFRKAINRALRDNGYTELADQLDDFANQYDEKNEEVPSEEYMAQLGGLLTAAKIDVNNLTEADKSLLDQIKDIVNNIMIELTGQPVFLEDAKPKDILNFMSTMSDMMARGEDVSGFFKEAPGVNVVTRAQKTIEEANEDFGIEDGEANFKTRAQKLNVKEVRTLSDQLTNTPASKLESIKKLINKGSLVPKKTQKAYKLFKVKKGFPGELFPLFVGANESVTTSDWIDAKAGELKPDPKTGRQMVKSTLGPLAYRPGWHAGDSPMATHIGSKANKSDKKPTFRSPDHVWAEVEVSNDVDWQKVANERAEYTKDGKMKPSTAQITDQLPMGGFYRYKTNANMTGNWIISGNMKVNRVLTEQEVESINKKMGTKDLPRQEAFDYDAYGFGKDGLPLNKDKVVSNQIARAYIVAKETGDNPELVKEVESLGVKTRAQKKKTISEKVQNEIDNTIEEATKREDALAYLEKSKIYQESNDKIKTKMVRDLNKRLGVKSKRVAKAFATRRDTKKITVNEKTALKRLIRAQAKAANDAISARKAVVTAVKAELDTLFKRGLLTTRQMRAILNKALSLNFFNADHVEKFVKYIERVYNNAEYADNMKKAESIKRKIKKAIKNKDIQAETRDIAKRFLGIEPFYVEDLNEYLEIANNIFNATSATVARVTEEGPDVSFKKAMSYDKTIEYTTETLNFQEEEKKKELLEKNEYLAEGGVLNKDMSLEEMNEIIRSLEEEKGGLPSVEKQRMIRDFVKKHYDTYKTILSDMLKDKIDPFTGEIIDISKDQESIVKEFLNIDIDTLNLKDAYKIVESIDNFIVNQNTDGMQGSIRDYRGAKKAKKAKEKGYKARKLRAFFTKKFGRDWAEQIEQLTLTTSRMFGERTAAAFDELSGLSELLAVKNKAVALHNKYIEKYSNNYKNIKDFNSLENIFSRGMLAYVSRASQGTEAQQLAEFKKRKINVETTIAEMKTNRANEKQKKEVKVLEEVYNEILKNSNSPKEVASKSKDFNRKAVSFWQAAFNEIFDDLQSVSRGVYNTVLDKDFKYTPDTYSRFGDQKETSIENIMNSSSFFGINDKFDTKESGSMMKATKPELQQGTSRIVSFDFDLNMSRSMLGALVDIKTAPIIRQVDAFYSSNEINDIIESAEDLEVLRKKIAAYIRATKRKDYQREDELSRTSRAINYISTFAVSRALGSLAQIVKQTIPVAANTLILSGGRLPLRDVLKAKKFIDDSGYAIGLRGIASQADIQSMNKILKRAEESSGKKVLEALKELNQKYLELFVAKPDVFIARASWIAFYEQSLSRQGIDTKGIDWDSHELNREAADYAQRKVDRQQNYSDADLAGDFLRSKDPKLVLLRKTLFPFATFQLNKRSVLLGDMATLSNKLASKEDKKDAAMSLIANGVEMAMFHSMSIYISQTVYQTLAGLITGGDEEERKKKEARALKGKMYRVKSAVNEYISPVPNFTDEYVDNAVNKILDLLEIEEGYRLPKTKEESFSSKIGMVNIPLSKVYMTYEIAETAAKGSIEYRGKERKFNKEDRETMKYIAAIYGMYTLGALPADFGTIANKAYYMVLNKYKKGSSKKKSPFNISF
jgi:hypothetical protein